MAERTGSFPLMNLAADFGLDYGDVLLMADYYRSVENQQGARMRASAHAGERIDRRLEERAGAKGRFYERLSEFSLTRWPPAPPQRQMFSIIAVIDVHAANADEARVMVQASLDDAQLSFSVTGGHPHG